MKVKGTVIKFGDNIDTDVILPGKYLVLTDPKELAQHAMAGLDETFPQKAKKGVIVIGGKNFGCGSSREQAPIALKHAGVQCVLAESFARIFFRNSINIGLPVLEAKGITAVAENGDKLEVNLETGKVQNLTKQTSLQANKLPAFIMEILSDGGLIENLKKRVKTK
ncbi:MAG: 3-isopropylmalate dehydratase small subunit [Candidatus Bathyarchaeia archaeon]